MNAPMYTRCPQCQTIFHVTPAQLGTRQGLVRCGICANAFQADRNLLDTLPDDDTDGRVTREITHTVPIEAPVATDADGPDDDLPLMNEFPLLPKRRRVPTAVWFLGGILLLTLLTAQVAYFYAPQLARHAPLRPWLTLYCEEVGCDLRPARGTLPIELVESSVAPHPHYENALRLLAVLVNRADTPQPWPLMEVSLTDSEGQVLTRRHFTAAHYLEQRSAGAALASNIVARARLDVTNADGRAVGYEIRLLAASE